MKHTHCMYFQHMCKLHNFSTMPLKLLHMFDRKSISSKINYDKIITLVAIRPYGTTFMNQSNRVVLKLGCLQLFKEKVVNACGEDFIMYRNR